MSVRTGFAASNSSGFVGIGSWGSWQPDPAVPVGRKWVIIRSANRGRYAPGFRLRLIIVVRAAVAFLWGAEHVRVEAGLVADLLHDVAETVGFVGL